MSYARTTLPDGAIRFSKAESAEAEMLYDLIERSDGSMTYYPLRVVDGPAPAAPVIGRIREQAPATARRVVAAAQANPVRLGMVLLVAVRLLMVFLNVDEATAQGIVDQIVSVIGGLADDNVSQVALAGILLEEVRHRYQKT